MGLEKEAYHPPSLMHNPTARRPFNIDFLVMKPNCCPDISPTQDIFLLLEIAKEPYIISIYFRIIVSFHIVHELSLTDLVSRPTPSRCRAHFTRMPFFPKLKAINAKIPTDNSTEILL